MAGYELDNSYKDANTILICMNLSHVTKRTTQFKKKLFHTNWPMEEALIKMKQIGTMTTSLINWLHCIVRTVWIVVRSGTNIKVQIVT